MYLYSFYYDNFFHILILSPASKPDKIIHADRLASYLAFHYMTIPTQGLPFLTTSENSSKLLNFPKGQAWRQSCCGGKKPFRITVLQK